MKIYLVRHARPVEDSVDAARPLSQEGEQELRRLAEHLAERGDVNPLTIIHSGKLRASQTAEILEEYLGPYNGTQAMPGLSPDDDITPWEAYFVGVDEDTMIVGHMPFVGRLAFELCHGRTGGWQPMFRTAEVACLEGAAGDWSVAWHIAPDDLEG